jgi:hypothetical protein
MYFAIFVAGYHVVFPSSVLTACQEAFAFLVPLGLAVNIGALQNKCYTLLGSDNITSLSSPILIKLIFVTVSNYGSSSYRAFRCRHSDRCSRNHSKEILTVHFPHYLLSTVRLAIFLQQWRRIDAAFPLKVAVAHGTRDARIIWRIVALEYKECGTRLE